MHEILLGLLVSTSLFAPRLAAQEPLSPPERVTIHAERFTGASVDIPPPPKTIVSVPIGPLPPVPAVDAGLPQPGGPPVVVGDLDGQAPQAGAFTFFRNRDHRPLGRSQFNPGEPSACASRDTWFATGNTYASLSKDSGMTWSHVNPYTLFPANDGGLCCDQRVIYDPVRDFTIWYLQYGYSASTQTGGVRIAVANGRNNLRNSNWTSYYLTPLSFGLGTGVFFDYPDIATTPQHLYWATNVFNSAGNYVNSMVARIPLEGLRTGSFVVSYYRRSGGTSPMGGGFAYRFTQTFNGSPNPTMYWASHNNTSSIRIFAWADGSSGRLADVDRTIPTWVENRDARPGPDGRDWLAGTDHRISSGYINPTFNEGAFLWMSSSNGGSRPQSYVRVQVFRPSDRAIIATEDVYNSTFAFAFPAVGLNSLGHAGLVMAGGSSTVHVTTFAMIADNYFPAFQGNSVFALANGTNGCSNPPRWGDYFTVVANPIDPRTFLGTGTEMNGGTAVANTVHRTAWFGRDDYTPAWVSLNVSSVPSGVPIGLDETDRFGAKDGATPLTRSFTPRQGYTLRAPATFVSGGDTWLFVGWSGSGGSTTSPVFTVADIGTTADSATATYSLQTIVSVDDRNVAGAVPITVGTADLDGRKDGSTAFTRRYRSADGPFTFTAPALAGDQPFRRWYVNGVAQATGQLALTVVPAANAVTIEAEYCDHVHGSYATFAAGCQGSNGLVPLHTSASHPDTGASVTHEIANLRPGSPAVMFLGFSNTLWGATPLPLSLGFLGANPSCNLLTEVFLQLPMPVDGAGHGSLTFKVTSDPAAVGMHTYTQVVAGDLFVPEPVKLVVSNGLDMTIGGSTLGGLRCP